MIKQYEENGVKVTRYEAPQKRTKHIIKGKSKRQAGWSAPTKTPISSIYNSVFYLSGRRKQDSVSTNKMIKGREWQQHGETI